MPQSANRRTGLAIPEWDQCDAAARRAPASPHRIGIGTHDRYRRGAPPVGRVYFIAFWPAGGFDLRTAPAGRPFSERLPPCRSRSSRPAPVPLPPDAEIVGHDGKPHVRMKERGKPVLYPLTKDGAKYLRPSKRWYFDLRDATGTVRRVKGFADLKATEQLAAEMERKASRVRGGFTDPAEEHARRPLADHLKDYAAAPRSEGERAGARPRRPSAACPRCSPGAGSCSRWTPTPARPPSG